MVRPLRIVFFGTPAFAVPTLDRLLESAHQVVAVVTQPDRPSGRGQRVHDAPVKARALAAGVPVLQPSTLKTDDVVQQLTTLESDLGVVAAYGKILTEAVLRTPRLGMINVHASLLPRHRGAAPVHRAIMAGDTETGVTIMRVVRALDAGPMLATVHRPIAPDETSDVVERDLAVLGADLLRVTVDRLAAGPLEEVPQDEGGVTYASRLTRDDGRMDWSRTARELHDQIRGLHPWPHAYTYLRGQRLILHQSTALPGAAHALPGVVVAAHRDELVVAAGSGLVQLRELQAEGKRPMSARDFLAGHTLAVGEQLQPEP
jgi:methionyl-tRNA formyltransferase